ncbi:MAG: alcohol dehydrogenase catalytic domain-containing protein [Anaerolineales bacterium]|nr:alcohol dehydrogenase catalytic domain-containing protein [Anaerolineales bacterium]
MKAVVKVKEGPGNLALLDVPVPEIKPHEVLVKIRGTGLCGTDALIYNWTYRGKAPVPTPIILGHEAAGEIAEIGAAVKNVKVGDRVALDALIGCGQCYYCRRGRAFNCPDWAHLGISYDGTFAEYVAQPGTGVRTLPDGLAWEDTAFLELAACAAHTMERITIQAGDRVVIIGPGPLGILHLMIAKSAGAWQVIVIGTDGDDQRLELAKKLGADLVLNESELDEVGAVRDFTGGLGADVVIETANTPRAVGTAFRIGRSGATLVFMGFAKSAQYDHLAAVRNCFNVQYVLGGVGRHVEKAIHWIESGKVLPSRLITHRITLDEAEKGFDEMVSRRATKVFINMEGA